MDAEVVGHGDLAATDTSKCEDTVAAPTEDGTLSKQAAFGGGWRAFAIITALSVVALLPAIEGTVVSTALPTIVGDLHGGELYVWVVNSYFLTR